MSRTLWRWGRSIGPPLVFTVLVWRLGATPFLDGLRTVDAGALASAASLAALTTICCAWRWRVVAGVLGLELSLPAAAAAYYRSLLLNVTLPGGVVGDVHRAISQGHRSGDMPRALRSVAWERFAGQVVQVLATVVVLLVLPSPVHAFMPLIAIVVLLAGLGAVVTARVRAGGPRSTSRRRQRAEGGDRGRLTARRAWPGIVVASAVVVGGHAATFLIAARTAGISAPPPRMLPLALLVMSAMVLPSIGGWGPREGVAAWAFAAAGLGAGRGIATAVVYGVMVFVSSLPGVALLVVSWWRGFHRSAPEGSPPRERPAHV